VDLIAQKTLTLRRSWSTAWAHGLDFVGEKVWFTAEAAKAIGSYDPATKKR